MYLINLYNGKSIEKQFICKEINEETAKWVTEKLQWKIDNLWVNWFKPAKSSIDRVSINLKPLELPYCPFNVEGYIMSITYYHPNVDPLVESH